jgi:MFS family permease
MTDPARVSLRPVLLVNFIGALGFSIVLPFLVFVVQDLGGNAFVYGLVGAAYPAMQFVGAPVLGRWSDRYGRRRILLLSQAGTLVSWLIFLAALYAPSVALGSHDGVLGTFTLTLPLALLGFARALDGLTGGNISVANAYVADVSSEAERNANFGRMGVAYNTGMILGPALASVLGSTPYGEMVPVVAAAAISLVATVFIAVALPESRPAPVVPSPQPAPCGEVFGQGHHKGVVEPVSSTRADALSLPGVRHMLVLYFVILLSFNLYYTAMPVHAASTLGWTVVQTGVFFAVLSAAMVFVEGPVLARLSKRFAEPGLITVGLLLLAVNFALMASSQLPAIGVAILCFAFGNGIMWPSVTSHLAGLSTDEAQGQVQGLAGSAGSAASIVGLLAGGVVYEAAGVSTFYLASAVALLACVLSLRLR